MRRLFEPLLFIQHTVVLVQEFAYDGDSLCGDCGDESMKRAHFTKTGHKNVESLKITANFGGSADPPQLYRPI